MSKKKDYENWNREDLIKEIDALRKQKTYGLVWERDSTKECFDYYLNWDGSNTKEQFTDSQNKLPVLKEVKENNILTDLSLPNNILIEGDNYHSLAVLNFTHRMAIDVIYIDPPYNTGHNDFKYNDKWVEIEDGYRHSKWLSFMEKRLKLCLNLLKKQGIIFISIDDNEVAQLKLLCDEIFNEANHIAILPTVINLKGNNDQFGFAGTHEYVLVYAKSRKHAHVGEFLVDDEGFEDWEQDDYGYFKKGANLKSTGVNAPRHKRRNLFYPIFITDEDQVYVTNDDKIPLARRGMNDTTLLPITGNQEMTWRWEKKKVASEPYNIIVSRTGSSVSIYKKQRPKLGDLPTKKPKTLFYKPEYSSGNGTAQIKRLFGSKIFNNPKPLDLIKDLLLISSDKDSVILDFFAGSGTTGHAVLDLNDTDGGKRKFILCTNNEENICTDVCYPRIAKVISGYSVDNSEIQPLRSNLKYFKTDFVESAPTDMNKKTIVEKSTEMLCVKEDAYVKVAEGSGFKIFKNSKVNVGIIFDMDAIDEFIDVALGVDGYFHTYVFSLDSSVPETEFDHLKDRVQLCPIPEAILNVYRRIFKEK
ncbi:site-specific DNA-methyltransferase [Dehalogenimonas sp. THU2]|uniref:site-specific DNA-methyltransferase n=1 Tax=Dehalogenimonas sp. THU2 TaxID=3151121 RepID=UPI0032187ECC